MKLHRRMITGGAVIVAFGLISPTSSHPLPIRVLEPVPAATSADNTCYNYKKKEKKFTQKMNGERSKKGKTTMRLDPELSKVARKHAKEMVNKDLLHHTPATTLTNRVTSWETLGENVGVGQTVDSLHNAFMNSPGHRDNILYTSFKYVGVGTKKDSNGTLWVTVIFEAASNPGTTLKMPKC